MLTRRLHPWLLSALTLTAVVTPAHAAGNQDTGSSWRDALYQEARVVYERHAESRRGGRATNPLLRPNASRSYAAEIVLNRAPPVSWDEDVIEQIDAASERAAARHRADWLNRALVRPVYERRYRDAHFGVYSILGIPVLVSLTW